MKVLFISHAVNLDGGAERVLLRIVSSLDREKYQPVVVLPGEGQFSAALTREGIPYYLVPQAWMVFAHTWRLILTVNFLLNMGAVKRLREIIRKEEIDVVFTNSVVTFAGAVAAATEGVPHIWYIRETVFSNPELDFGFGKDILRSALDVLSDRIITVSAAVRDDLDLGVLGEKVCVIHNGLPSSAWGRQDPGELTRLRAELGIPPEARVIFFLGLTEGKRPDYALEAFAGIGRDDVYLLMVGRPADKLLFRRLQKFVTENGLEQKVIFTGFRNDVPKLMALSDMAVFPTTNEAFGSVTVEAMAAGIPVIGGKGGGTKEIIQHGVNGFLVENGDPREIASRIRELLDNSELLRKMGAAAYEDSKKFSQELQMQRLEEIIDSVADIKDKAPKKMGSIVSTIFRKNPKVYSG